MAKKKRESQAEITRLNMTPMIDVVFQLIVFFLCSMKFKTLDMKIEAFLPKDRGLAKTLVKLEETPKVTVVLKRQLGEPVTRVKIANQTIGDTAPDKEAATWAALRARAEGALKAHMANGGKREDVKGEVDASQYVPTGVVIRAVDTFIEAGMTDVTFIGTPPPDSTLDKIFEAARKAAQKQ